MNARTDSILLRSGAARVEISLKGAELRRWSCAGQELLWEPDAAVWPAAAPLLFPIVGWARDGMIRVAGENYPIGVHGFAAHEMFCVAASGADFCTLHLHDNERTRAQYPFGFRLAVTYRLAGSSMAISAVVRNIGAQTMPYAFGLHPGFRWPLDDAPREAHSIEFERAEDARVPVIAPGGLFAQTKRGVPLSGKSLALNDELLNYEALCFLDARSRRVRFRSGVGCALTVETEGFRHWALWSRPPAPYLCVEAWTGHGDPVGFGGELAEKPSMILLQPGETGVHRAVFSYEAVSAPVAR
jgi:galactose mutarotase-like enzyme